MAKNEPARVKATMFAPVKAGTRNSVRSSIGRLCRRSTITNVMIRMAEPARQQTISVDPHPFSFPCTSA